MSLALESSDQDKPPSLNGNDIPFGLDEVKELSKTDRNVIGMKNHNFLEIQETIHEQLQEADIIETANEGAQQRPKPRKSQHDTKHPLTRSVNFGNHRSRYASNHFPCCNATSCGLHTPKPTNGPAK
ncbi:hypothetical protein VNO78_21637 [Psophocarpus tetragonolobus]|uniref:Uncharacterized protein n=1 Tax=Psophocarpus tetragonolobus TaxID=3891 RepID=A0AAN9XID1_PSOTE